MLCVEADPIACSEELAEGSGHRARLTKITLISPESYLDKRAAALDINKSPDVVNCLGDSPLICVIRWHVADDWLEFICSTGEVEKEKKVEGLNR